LADLDDETLDGLLANIDSANPRKKPRRKSLAASVLMVMPSFH
jgi:hypothetical protein